MGLDNELLFAGMVVEAAILGLLLYRRVWQTLPVFCFYVAWGLLSDATTYAVHRLAGHASQVYLTAYLASSVLDSVLQVSVLIEVAWSTLRPLRPALTYRTLALVSLLIVATGAAIWPFAGAHGLAGWPAAWRNIVHLEQTTSLLRILFFLLLTACSQLLSIGWRDRELQVATGLGFYSFVNVGVDVLRQHQDFGPRYGVLNHIVVAGYLCSLLYWGFSFAQKQAMRREFTPQMQSFLLAVAGTARTTRMTLSSPVPPSRARRDE